MSESQAMGTVGVVPARSGSAGGWQRWAPYAAVVWSLIYAVLGGYWAVAGNGFPYSSETTSNPLGSLLARSGPTLAWVVVMLAGIPAAALGVAMLRGVRGRLLRPLFITAGVLLAGTLLLLMTDLNLLILLGYVPLTVVRFLRGEDISRYQQEFAQGMVGHQMLCLVGGFLWLGATVVYARRSGDACLYCGRRDGPEGWQSPNQAARWGRIAVYVAFAAPVLYALVRYAWALGFPLGMTEEYLRQGQKDGIWISGLFLATFGLVGALLMLGLVQGWGEVFPRWMIGLGGRRVPIALAVVPASLISVLLMVGGIVIWAVLPAMTAGLESTGVHGSDLTWGVIVQVGPTLLFPLWGLALAVATLGYYYRRRGPCGVCGRGTK